MKLFKNKDNKPTRQPKLQQGQDDFTFRRSRTLTGTTSNNVTSSAQARSQLKTPRLKAHELHQKKRHIMRILGVVLLCIGAIAYLLSTFIYKPQFQYQQSNNIVDQKYIQGAMDYFAAYPLERFGGILNKKQFEDFMKNRFTEISELHIERSWYGGDSHFTVFFRKPILSWQSSGKQFYVDAQGVAFEYDYYKEPVVPVTDQSGVTTDAGASVASKRFLSFLGKMVGAVNALDKGKVVSIILPASTREIDLKLEGRDYPVKTHSDREPLAQAVDIKSAVDYFDRKGVKPEYIDVRVEGRAFYK